jgi:hypothetical protein
VFDEARAIRDGGGFGSIIGRNSFQRPKEHALRFLQRIMKIYAGEVDWCGLWHRQGWPDATSAGSSHPRGGKTSSS